MSNIFEKDNAEKFSFHIEIQVSNAFFVNDDFRIEIDNNNPYYKRFEFLIYADHPETPYEWIRDKFIPLKANRLSQIRNKIYKMFPNKEDQCNPCILFINQYIQFLAEQYPIMKDYQRTLEEYKLCLLPIAIQDMIQYPNVQILMTKTYRNAEKFKVSYTKLGMNFSYVFLKLASIIKTDEIDSFYQLLLKPEIKESFKKNSFFSIYRSEKKKLDWLTLIYEIKLPKTSKIEPDYLYDLLRMTRLKKQKITMKYNSKARIIREHDTLALEFRLKEMQKLKIRKNSKFNPLRKLLPKEFKWITTKKRLALEATIQHNCVASYAEDINRDICAIYSVVLDDVRYTIEFQKIRNTYQIVQMYKAYNEPAEKRHWEYVERLIHEKER